MAESGTAAYKIRAGSMDVFLVPYKAERAGRRILIHEAKAGETVPGFEFTDREHTRWVFSFRAAEELELTEIEGGVTNVLKKKFADRAGLDRLAEEGFEYSVIEKYNEQKIKEDRDISQKEEEAAKAAEEKKQTIRQMTATGSMRKGKKTEPAATESGAEKAGNLIKSIRAAVFFSRANTEKGERLWIAALSAVAAAAGVALCVCSGAAFSCFAIVFLLLTVLKNGRIVRAASSAGSRTQDRAFGALFELDEATYRKYGKTELAALCMNICGMVKHIIYSAYSMGSGAFVCAVMFAAAICRKPGAGLMFLLVCVIAGCLITAGTVTAARYNRQAGRSREKANTRLYHALRNINKIKVAGSEENIQRDYYKVRADYAAGRLSAIHLTGAAEAIQIMAIIAVIPISALSSSIPALALPLAVLGGCWIQTVRQISQIPQTASDLRRVRIVLEEEKDEAKEPVDRIESIEMENVRFSYGEREVLHGMDMDIHRGETVGLIGDSGSGKTTLLKLMTGIEKPESGTVKVNGTDMKEIDMKSFRKRIGIVSQEETLTAASLIDNIRMGSDVSAEEVFDAIIRVGLAGFVSKLPMGVDTILSEEGGSISSGQKQKIFIARALVRKPDLIILDEAMSEMDNESIEDICSALNELDAAIIIVSHRMEPLKYCDKIVVTE